MLLFCLGQVGPLLKGLVFKPLASTSFAGLFLIMAAVDGLTTSWELLILDVNVTLA